MTGDLYTDAQWRWVAQKLAEGYSKRQLSEFLGVSRELIRRALRARGLMYPELPDEPLDRAEFNALADEGADSASE